MKDTKDNFSEQSATYAQFRPGYPQELFDWLYTHCLHYDTAWDCATGNGQAAIKLSDKFKVVYATDISINQLDNAMQIPNIIYSEGKAEEPEFADNSFDLVTTAQALHWFDHSLFFKAVQRVAKPGALFAGWGYNLPGVNPAINDILDNFYRNVVGPYWDAERKYVDNEYRDIALPFEEIPCPGFGMSYHWTAEHMIGYLNSWSAVQHYIKKNRSNPTDMIKEQLSIVWGKEERMVTFPIFMRAGIIKK